MKRCLKYFLLTGNAAVYHPADHAEQEEEVTHEVAVIPTSCRGETRMSEPDGNVISFASVTYIQVLDINGNPSV